MKPTNQIKSDVAKLKGQCSLAAARGSTVRPCVSCGAVAVASTEDGEYCKDCLQLHIVEKMFLNLTKLQCPGRTLPLNDHLETDGREFSEGNSAASARQPND